MGKLLPDEIEFWAQAQQRDQQRFNEERSISNLHHKRNIFGQARNIQIPEHATSKDDVRKHLSIYF